jgi:hypothetical protein
MSRSRRAESLLIPDKLRVLLDEAFEHAAVLAERHRSLWNNGKEAAWELDQDEGILRFRFEDGVVVSASAQIIGTFDTTKRSWMWSWHNASILPSLQTDALRIRDFGESHGFDLLTKPSWSCDEDLCWRLAALALKICDRQGIYRGLGGKTAIFFTYERVTISGPPRN